jgi:protein SCO1/2
MRESLAMAFACALCLAATSAGAQDGAFSEIPLVDHDGHQFQLHQDLLHDKTVVMASFFTSCLAVCPKVTRLMKDVEHRLGPRCGRQVHLISFSVDPETDTPERLRAYRKRHGIDEDCWTFVTGTPENMDLALRELGFFSDMAENHTSLIVVGDEQAGNWRKAEGLGKSKAVMKLIRQALDDRP